MEEENEEVIKREEPEMEKQVTQSSRKTSVMKYDLNQSISKKSASKKSQNESV